MNSGIKMSRKQRELVEDRDNAGADMVILRSNKERFARNAVRRMDAQYQRDLREANRGIGDD